MLTELSLTNFRNIKKSVIYPVDGINLFVGDNGSGKTSILEAIYMLGMGRSFRTRHLKNVVQFDQQHCQLFARIIHGIPVGLQYSHHSPIQIRLNNSPLKKLSELANHLPLQYIPSNCHQLFELGPKFRRKVLDWGVFHVEHEFLFHWQAYKKVLTQRNAAIRNNKPNNEIIIWNKSLVTHGLQLTEYRNDYLEKLLVKFKDWFTLLCNDFKDANFELRFLTGWSKGEIFTDVLVKNLERDRALGYTRSGPHAADWSIKINGNDPGELLSRGQQKLFFLALCLAQISLMALDADQKTVLLIDDLSSELDLDHQVLVLKSLEKLSVQSFITTTNEALSMTLKYSKNNHLFHVEHGVITASTDMLST